MKIDKHNHWLSKQNRILAAALTVVAMITFILCASMVHQSHHIITTETNRSLKELSRQVAYKVNQRVNFNLETMDNCAATLSLISDNTELCNKYIQDIALRTSFSWIGTVDLNGVLTVPGQESVVFCNQSVIQNALNGTSGVSENMVTIFGDSKGILFASPIIKDHRITGVVTGQVSNATIKLLLNTEMYEGAGFSHIVSSDGEYIFHPNNKSSLFNGKNFYEEFQEKAVFTDGFTLKDLQMQMKAGKSGTADMIINDSYSRIMCYTPLDYGGWYLLSAITPKAYEDKINSFTNLALLVSLITTVMFAALLLFTAITTSLKNKEISRIAYIDPITGGFTSSRFELELLAKNKDFHPYAFISIDIRKFKLINDSFGSTEGNRVLKYVHDTVKDFLVEGEFLSRISSDIFNLVLNTTEHEEIIKRLEAVTEAINAFNKQMVCPYYLPLDFGVYIVNNTDNDIITIRDRSNSARKNNKNHSDRHLCSCVFYSDLEWLHMRKEKEMENAMEQALANNEFVVYLQPKVDLKANETIGAEALVRWNSPEHGLIPPGDFIPLFEKNGFITQLDLYVFENVCKLQRKWIDRGLTPLPVSVNLSRNHLKIPDFLEPFTALQQQYRIPPQLLEIELTETMVFENLQFLKQVITRMHQIGFKCSMDDFGSGYSSLAVLKEVPVDILKLDRAFFSSENDERGNNVVESVICLAKKLGMQTVAEGVETPRQIDFLKAAACDIGQGFIFSRPIDIESFEKEFFH